MPDPKPAELQPTMAADLPPSTGAEPSSAFGQKLVAQRYEILGLVGSGGMGTVYRARDTELDEVVALKVLRRDLVDAPGMLDRFRREVKLARRVTHKNVARAFDIGEHAGEKFLTMEFVDGEPLSALVARERRLPTRRVVAIATAVCEGLAAAHDAGVVHRDLKPDNILVASDGRVVITDFGIARAFEPGASSKTVGIAVGTPAYMAPEQVEGSSAIDARADVYALGAVLHELFTGQAPWRGDSPYAVAAARLVSPPPDPRTIVPRLPREAAEIVLRAMARQPGDRFASAREVAEALKAVPVDDVALSAVVPTPPPLGRATLASTGSTGDKTVAVLPFRNSGPAEDEYLADGLTEDLIDLLSVTEGLRVRPRGVVMSHKGEQGDVRTIGVELDVQVVVEGSIRRVGTMLRVSTRVISVANGFQLWAKRFDRPAAELLAVSDEMAGAVAQALTVDHVAAPRKAPTDPVALDLYLRARHEYHQWEAVAVMRAVDLFAKALELAPNDPMILSGAVLARARLWFFGVEGSAEQAREMAERAVRLAPNRGEALVARAAVRFQEQDVPGAVQDARAALVVSPSLYDAHDLLARIFVETGPPERGIEHALVASKLEPSDMSFGQIFRVHALLRDWHAMDRVLDEILARQTIASWPQIMRALFWTRDEARIAKVRAHPRYAESTVGRALLDFLEHPSDVDPFQRLPMGVNAARASWRTRCFVAQARTEIAVLMGNRESALEHLRAAVDAGLIDLLWTDCCAALDSLRADPSFPELRARVEARAMAARAALTRPTSGA